MLLEDETINQIAQAHSATPAQVLLAWAISRGTAVIPKSVKPERLIENFKAQELALSEADCKALASLDKNRRYVDGSFWAPPGSPYSVESLWG